MNAELLNLLKRSVGSKLTADLAADIYVATGRIKTLEPEADIARIQPADHLGFTFSVERIEDIAEEIKPLHRAHRDETERHRHGLPFQPGYATFIRYEQAGRYMLFTLRSEGKLSGNCAMYLDKSAHTQTTIATEDTLYLLPEGAQGQGGEPLRGVCRECNIESRGKGNQYYGKDYQQGRTLLSAARIPSCGKWLDQNTGG